MIIHFYLLVLNHIQVNSNFFILHVGILDFKGTMFLFCRLLPCVNKMFIYKEKWYQVRDPQNLNILKGWNLARKSMKRYRAYDMLLHGSVYLLYPLTGIWNTCVILVINITMFWLGQKCLMISLIINCS